MKTIHKKRLQKLIAFLRKLPRKQFNFEREVTKSKNGCATVACAIGWTPSLFPRMVRFRSRDCLSYFRLSDGRDCESFAFTAEHLFGIPATVACSLFSPGSQKAADHRLPTCKGDATPKQVARMLEKFIELQEGK